MPKTHWVHRSGVVCRSACGHGGEADIVDSLALVDCLDCMRMAKREGAAAQLTEAPAEILAIVQAIESGQTDGAVELITLAKRSANVSPRLSEMSRELWGIVEAIQEGLPGIARLKRLAEHIAQQALNYEHRK